MHIRLRQIAVSTLALMIAVQAIGSVAALAQTDSTSGQGLQISPVISEITVDPGKSYIIKITVQNVTTGDLNYRAFVNDFRAKDETGAPLVLLDQNLPDALSLVKWVSPIPSLLVKSKQSIVVPVTINVPVGAEPGGHYGVVRFSGIAPNLDSTSVALSASVGTLVLLRVNGQAKEALELKDFFAQRSGRRGSFFESGPLTLVERIYDSGNVHLKPQGNIIVKDMGGRTISTLAVNKDGGNILPASTRRFEQDLNKTWLFGRYSAHMSLAYGTQGQVLQAVYTFWIIPWRLIGLVLIALIVIIFGLRLAIKRYNARIIQKARGGNNSP